jgi:hypothetical protein
MAQALAKPQEAASPWAYVAFEAEKPEPVWEALEPEASCRLDFAPFDSAKAETRAEPFQGKMAPQITSAVDGGLMAALEGNHYGPVIESYENRLRELEQFHQATLAELEKKYAVELLRKLTSHIESLGSDLGREIGTQLTRLLAPVLVDHARKSSMAALTRDLQRILSSADVAKLTLSGPPELVKQVRDALGEDASRLEICQNETADVTVQINSEVLATRLSGWAAVLKDVAA